MHPNHVRLPARAAKESFALVATLALLAVATILLVLFVSTTTLDRSASYSYSQSMKADQIGLGGLHLIVSQLQAEMYKDAMPDTNNSPTSVAIFTNVTSANILPQPNVTNSSLPQLIKMSTNAPFFFTGNNPVTTYDTAALSGSANLISSTVASVNGRSASTNVWNQVYLGQYPNNGAAPYWLTVTRAGLTNASGITTLFGATGNTLNNPATANTNYAVGRIAYAVYDEGGLLDINAAGYANSGSASLSAAQLAQIKGTLAGADLTQVGITSPATFVAWRNAASAASASSYVNYVTNFASSNGFEQVYSGDSAFISRQDLIRAAQTGNDGLTTSALSNLATFTREMNAPTWGPTIINATAGTAYSYINNALSATRPTPPTPTSPPAPVLTTATPATANPNRFVPHVRYTNGGTVTSYYPNGNTYTYTVKVGDSVMQHRFPLDRLVWVTPKGPSASLATTDPFYNAGGTAAAIKACFGLQWGPVSTSNPDSNWTTTTGNVLWQYVGSPATSTTEQQYVETLDQVAAESTPREPNFFELLQAGILSGSLGDFSGVEPVAIPKGGVYFTVTPRDAQLYPMLQLLRIGASMISQVQSSAYPINIEYSQAQYTTTIQSATSSSEAASGQQVALVASGVANLPYINLLQPVSGVSPWEPSSTWSGGNFTSSSEPQHYLATYLLFGLWNPHQQPPTQPTRPNVRLYLQGQISAGVRWGYDITTARTTASPYKYYTATYPGNYGPTVTLAANSTYVALANTSAAGVNGFLNPGLLTATDVASSVTDSLTHATGFIGTAIATTTGVTAPLVLDPTTSYEAFDIRSTTTASTGLPLKINIYGTNTDTGTPNTGNNPGIDCTQTSITANRMIFTFGYVNPPTTASMFQMIMKYQDPSNANNWIPYDYWNGVNDPASWISGMLLIGGHTQAGGNTYVPASAGPPAVPASGDVGQPDPTKPFYLPTLAMSLYEGLSPAFPSLTWSHASTQLTCDPRSIRFGLWGTPNDNTTSGCASFMASDSLWSGAVNAANTFPANPPASSPVPTAALRDARTRTTSYALYGYGHASVTDNVLANMPALFGNQWLPALLSKNVPGTAGGSYVDLDGVQRIADSGLFSVTTDATQHGNPFYYPSANSPTSTSGQRTADRPIILNRPFNSVGELGYTFRDDPWRTLDFFSAYPSFNGQSVSADSGLLDLFSVTDTANSIVAGKVNLNTRNASVLAAILNQTVENAGDTVDNTTVSSLNSGSAQLLATALTNYTQSTAPLVNKDQLVTKFGPTLTSASFNSGDEQNVKPYREAYVRSLADVGQTRTWNLLIDLVAQAGKYPPNASNLAQFEVEGERHYWLHVAIDRFTGKVIDRQLELIGP